MGGVDEVPWTVVLRDGGALILTWQHGAQRSSQPSLGKGIWFFFIFLFFYIFITPMRPVSMGGLGIARFAQG